MATKTKKKRAVFKRCKCIAQIDKQIANLGAQVCFGFRFDESGLREVGPFIETEWISGKPPKRNAKTPRIIAAYCPSCGKKLDN